MSSKRKQYPPDPKKTSLEILRSRLVINHMTTEDLDALHEDWKMAKHI